MTDAPQEQNTSTTQATPVELFQRVVRDFMEEGKGIQDRINNAKTEVKKRYYKKKLQANNKMLANALIVLEKYKAQASTASENNKPE